MRDLDFHVPASYARGEEKERRAKKRVRRRRKGTQGEEKVRSTIARVLVHERVMPAPLAGDALHVAAATVHTMEYILSWNVRHLANPNKTRHLAVICLRLGFVPPQIVTPDLLWESDDEY